MNKSIFRQYTSPENYERIYSCDTLVKMWNHSKKYYSNNIALSDANSESTYMELDKELGNIRYNLSLLGIQAGDRVGIHLKNSTQFITLFLALATLGAIAVLFPAHWDNQRVTQVASNLSVVKTFDINNIYALNEKGSLRCTHVTAEDPCAIVFTSGTDGSPKGAVLSHKNILEGTINGCYGLQDIFEQKYLLILPLTHVFGLIRSCLTGLYTGSNIYVCDNKLNLFKDIHTFQPTVLVLVPALVELALQLSRQNKTNMFGDQLKYIICGAAPVSPRLIKGCQKLNIQLFPGYGLTESANLVSGNPEPLKYPKSVGYIYNHIQTKIVDNELYIKGPNVFMGYATTHGINHSMIKDGWFATGDLAKIDSHKLLYILGRKKDLIIRANGENISPAEIENIFLQSDTVQDCLVYSKKTLFKEKIILEVVPAIELELLAYRKNTIKQELKEINSNLPHCQQVDKIIIRKHDFARTPSMKIIRKKH